MSVGTDPILGTFGDEEDATSTKIGPIKVQETLKIIPAKRTASYSVDLGPAKKPTGRLIGKVNLKSLTIEAPTTYSTALPRTLQAIDALLALATAMRTELLEQGVTE